MSSEGDHKTPIHQKAWFQVTLLGAAIVSAIFQVIGPLPSELLSSIPAGLSRFLERASMFLARFGFLVMLGVFLLIAYWQRKRILAILLLTGRILRFAYVRSLGFLLRPVVLAILESVDHRKSNAQAMRDVGNVADNSEIFFEFITGRWRVTWNGTIKPGSEVAEIDSLGNYIVGKDRYRIELIEFVPGARAVFWKHFDSRPGRASEYNDLTISEDRQVMSGDGSPPDGLKLQFERL